MNQLAQIADEDLNDPGKAALYGKPELDAERARRQRSTTVSLRGEDQPPRDALASARATARAHGNPFSVCEYLGIRFARAMLGDAFEVELRRRQQAEAFERQSVQHAITVGSTVVLQGGRHLGPGDAITVEEIGVHGFEALGELRERGVVSSVSADVAMLRSLPSSVGPFVVLAETLRVGSRAFRRGDAIAESDFPPLPVPRAITDDMPLSVLTVADLRRFIVGAIDERMPRPYAVPPPMSEFQQALTTNAIERAPNYRPSASPTPTPAAPPETPAKTKKGIFR